MKVLKPHIERICKDEEALIVLFTALDVIEFVFSTIFYAHVVLNESHSDTKLIAKSLVSEIVSHAPTLYTTAHGRRSLLYLLVPRSTRHFTPAQINILAETDEDKKRTSKKDDDVRRSEIRKAASEGLLGGLIENRERVEEMIRDPGGSLLVTEIMLYAEGGKSLSFPFSDDLLPKS